jgi:hypothetical protein
MKKAVLLAAAALSLVACGKTYLDEPVAQNSIGFNTWNDVMTKAAKTVFAADDEFDVFGFKWNSEPSATATVFDDVDVKYDGTSWSYSPLRFWDSNYANYTFFAAYPKDQLQLTTSPAQTGLFVSKELAYNGEDEVLLVAQKKDVVRDDYGKDVQLKFKHVGSLVDIKVKKHSDIAAAKVEVTSIALSGIQTKGKFTVASYDATSKNPVGKEVSSVAGLGWELAATPVLNDNTAETYKKANAATLNASAGAGIDNAAVLFSNLVLMPQTLGTTDGSPMITISYKITTGESGSEDVITFENKPIFFGEFDKSEEGESEKANKDPRISAWMPGVHYTYYITINANAITFTASIDSWNEETGHYYLVK